MCCSRWLQERSAPAAASSRRLAGAARQLACAGGAANDGTPAAAAAYKEKSAELRAGGNVDGVGNWWGEVSGKPAFAMIKRGAKAVEDEAKARQLLDGDDIEWHGEHPDPEAPAMFKSVKGWYTKKFGSKASTKIILGSPT